jgi:hypothetical protein
MFDDVRAVGSGNPSRSASWVCLRSHRVTRVPTTSVLVRRKSPLTRGRRICIRCGTLAAGQAT